MNDITTKEKVIEYVNTFLTNQLKPNEIGKFVEIATAFNLNPFKREIYCIAYGEGQYRKLSIITGYEVYLKRAERINKLNGWDCEIIGEGNMKAVLTIYRKDWDKPFKHEVYYEECKQTHYDKITNKYELNSLWQKMPRFMLKKVCIAQGFRLCFSDELGGMPYTSDELSDEIPTEKDVTPKTVFSNFDEKYKTFLKLCEEQDKLIDANDRIKINAIISLYATNRLSEKALDNAIEVLKRYQVANKELYIVDEKLTDVLLSVEVEK